MSYIQYSNFTDFKQRKKDHISYVGNQARYSFIELDMSTGPMNNRPRENIFIYVDTELEASSSVNSRMTLTFLGGGQCKNAIELDDFSSSVTYRARFLISREKKEEKKWKLNE